ncbi:MAG: hypothetical protein KGO02_09665, partial [Alphaproteobacteria bacterium]|nr:hypothetical protein [Alphaproteobacteria bacterium]
FQWLRQNYTNTEQAGLHLIRDMLAWGGSQNGRREKFDDAFGGKAANAYTWLDQTVQNLDQPQKAIKYALDFPGIGLTYASKLLRFLDPDRYGALDTRLRKALCAANLLDKIIDGNKASLIKGYCTYMDFLGRVQACLEARQIMRPESALARANNVTGWRVADIEMALFQWAAEPAHQVAARNR